MAILLILKLNKNVKKADKLRVKSSRWQKVLNHFSSLLLFAFIFVNVITAFAGPGRTTYQAKIVKPDGYPLEATSVNFKFTMLDPTGSCVLYVEDYSNVNMVGGGGLISLTLGNGVRSYPSSGTLTFAQVFDNSTPMFNCQTPGAYNPTSTDNRKIVMQFNDGNGWQTLPAMGINAVPYAMYAEKSQDSLTLNGKADTAFVQKNSSDIPTCAAGQMLYFNGASFSCVAVSASGTVTSIAAAAPLSSSGGSTPTISITQATSSTNGYLSATDWNVFNNKQSATSGAIIASLGYTPLDSVSQSGVVSGTQYTKVTVDGKGRVTSGAQLTNSDVTTALGYTPANSATTVSSQWVTTGSNIYYNTGNIGIGTTTPYTKLEVSGGVKIGMESSSCAANFMGTLRYNAGSVEFCNGTTWAAFGVSSSGLTSLNGSTSQTQTFANGSAGNAPAFNTTNGVHTLNIPLASATGSVAAGLISNADYISFSNKITSSAASIAQVLGYVPVSATALGNYLVIANNLSDLTSSATARTNLGLGTLATANSIDLGSASATGIIADARFANQSNVTSGTQYTKVTVDGKGRVTSGTQLSSSDVTTALGYTPANSTSATQWVTSGTTINYTAGNVGIGTAAPTEKLQVAGNILVPSGSYVKGTNVGGGLGPNIRLGNGTNETVQINGSYVDIQSQSGFNFQNSNSSKVVFDAYGKIGAGVATPTATLHLKAGTSATNTAALKFDSGVLLATPEAGAVEYDGNNLYITDGTNTRRTIATGSVVGSIDNAANINNASGNITMYPNGGAGSVIVSATTTSTNSSTGALVVKGGLGVAGNINTAANLNVSGSSVVDGSLKLSSMTSGSVLFAGANGIITQDNSNFYWDGANKRLGLGTASPSWKLQIRDQYPYLAFQDTDNASGSIGTITYNQDGNFYFDADNPNTGMNAGYHFRANGATKYLMSITNSGTVGIGTTAPSGKVHIYSDPSVNAAALYIDRPSVATAASTTQRGIYINQYGANNTTTNEGIYVNVVHNTGGNSTGINTIANSTYNNAIGLLATGTKGDGAGPADIYGLKAITNITTNANSLGNIYAGYFDNAATGANLYGVYINNAVTGSTNYGIYQNGGAKNYFSGNVGIGTASPDEKLTVSSGKLAVINSARWDHSVMYHDGAVARYNVGGAENGLAFGVDGGATDYPASSYPEVMRLLPNGNVGVGTASPSFKLDVKGPIGLFSGALTGGTFDRTVIYSDDVNHFLFEAPVVSGTKYNTYFSHRGDGASGAKMVITGTGYVGIGSAVASSPLHVKGHATGGETLRLSPPGGGTEGGQFTLMDAVGTGGWEIDNWGSDGQEKIRIFRDKGENNVTNAFTISASGTVGIGTFTPNTNNPLHVAGTTGAMLRLQGTSAQGNNWIIFDNNGSDLGYVGYGSSGNKGMNIMNYQNDKLSLGTSSTEIVYILPSGNVGIGAATPGAALQVGGGTGLGDILLKAGSSVPGDAGDIIFQNNAGTQLGRIWTDSASSTLYLTGRTTNSPDLTLNSSGNVGIGVTAPTYQLQLSTDSAAKPGTSTWTIASDKRLKDIRAPFTRGMNELIGLNTIYFNYKKDNPLGLPSDKEYVGIKAQDVQKVIPEAVSVDEQGYLHVTNDSIIWTAVNAIKEIYKKFLDHDEQITSQQREIAELKVENAAKTKELEAMKAYLCGKDPAAPICK